MTYILVKNKVGADGSIEIRGAHREFWKSKDMEVMLSGGAETGKTITCLHKLNAIAWRYPGAQIAIVRKEASTMAGTVLSSYTKKVLGEGTPVITVGGVHPEMYVYPNGSTIWIGGMDKPGKVLSGERDIIYVNQAEQISLADWETLLTRVTGRAGNVKHPQLMGDCNPDNPTHWIRTRAASGALKLINTTHRDNPSLYTTKGELTEQGKKSLAVLDRLTGVRRMRLLQGLWAAPEGAIYDIFSQETHTVSPFQIPKLWAKFVGIDPVGQYTAALWGAFDIQNKILHIYREYYQPFGLTTPGHAANLMKLSEGETIFAWVGGAHGERQARADWVAAGIPLLESPIVEVWSGIDKVYQLLKDKYMVIHTSCPNLLNEIGSYRRKETGGKITDDIEGKDDYHCLDALRYMVGFITAPREQTQVVYDPVHIGRW